MFTNMRTGVMQGETAVVEIARENGRTRVRGDVGYESV